MLASQPIITDKASLKQRPSHLQHVTSEIFLRDGQPYCRLPESWTVWKLNFPHGFPGPEIAEDDASLEVFRYQPSNATEIAAQAQLVGDGQPRLLAIAGGHRAAMQDGAPRNHHPAGSRADHYLGVVIVVEIDGLTAPVGLPEKIGIVEHGDRRKIAVHLIGVAIEAVIDIGALGPETLAR